MTAPGPMALRIALTVAVLCAVVAPVAGTEAKKAKTAKDQSQAPQYSKTGTVGTSNTWAKQPSAGSVKVELQTDESKQGMTVKLQNVVGESNQYTHTSWPVPVGNMLVGDVMCATPRTGCAFGPNNIIVELGASVGKWKIMGMDMLIELNNPVQATNGKMVQTFKVSGKDLNPPPQVQTFKVSGKDLNLDDRSLAANKMQTDFIAKPHVEDSSHGEFKFSKPRLEEQQFSLSQLQKLEEDLALLVGRED